MTSDGLGRLNFKTAVIQMRPEPGNIRENLKKILGYINLARETHAKLVVFPELITSGYLLGDRWEHDAFMREITDANETIREASKGLVVVWGSVRTDWSRIGEDGKVRKYNAALIAQDGEWISNGVLKGWIPKTNLPKYRFFDDARHFYPAGKLVSELRGRGVSELWQLLQPFVVTIDGEQFKLSLSVCEDLWEDEYIDKPSRIHALHHPDLIIDISHSPWTEGKWHARDGMLERRVRDSKCPILYVNCVGLQNNTKNLIWFDGNSALIDANGVFRFRALQHEEGIYSVNFNDLGDPASVRKHTKGVAEIYETIICAMKEFFRPFPKVVIGLSGGIDSAVMAALLVDALGPHRVFAVNMPTRFNSQTTQDLARKCAESLGFTRCGNYQVQSIQDIVDAHYALLRKTFHYLPSKLVMENVQARARGSTLAAIAQSVRGVFTCNGNKTEIALNYFTLYGDGAGAAAFLGDLWKGQIYELARYINERAGREVIPQGIIDIVPSAELSADQNVDEGKGDPIFYPFHDKLLRAFIERRWDPTIVLSHLPESEIEEKLGCEPGTIAKFFPTRQDLINSLEWAWTQCCVEFKRHKLPPLLTISRRSFGFDRRDTMADAYLTDEYERLRQQFLGS